MWTCGPDELAQPKNGGLKSLDTVSLNDCLGQFLGKSVQCIFLTVCSSRVHTVSAYTAEKM